VSPGRGSRIVRERSRGRERLIVLVNAVGSAALGFLVGVA
jgi:hypothetical protein